MRGRGRQLPQNAMRASAPPVEQADQRSRGREDQAHTPQHDNHQVAVHETCEASLIGMLGRVGHDDDLPLVVCGRMAVDGAGDRVLLSVGGLERDDGA